MRTTTPRLVYAFVVLLGERFANTTLARHVSTAVPSAERTTTPSKYRGWHDPTFANGAGTRAGRAPHFTASRCVFRRRGPGVVGSRWPLREKPLKSGAKAGAHAEDVTSEPADVPVARPRSDPVLARSGFLRAAKRLGRWVRTARRWRRPALLATNSFQSDVRGSHLSLRNHPRGPNWRASRNGPLRPRSRPSAPAFGRVGDVCADWPANAASPARNAGGAEQYCLHHLFSLVPPHRGSYSLRHLLVPAARRKPARASACVTSLPPGR